MRIQMRALKRQTYAILFAFAAQSSFAAPPPNDDWINAISISPTQLTAGFTDTQLVAEATVEPTDPIIQCKVGDPDQRGNTLWYKLTTGAQAVYLKTGTGSDYDANISVYTGAPGSFRLVPGGCNDDGGANFGALIDGLRLAPNTAYSIMTARPGPSLNTNTLAFTAGLAAVKRVSKLADTNDGVCDADCSLREAINTGSGGAVELQAGDYAITIANTAGGENNGVSGDLDIAKGLFFYGIDAAQTSVSIAAALSDRVFDLDPTSSLLGPTISFNDMTIRGGNPFASGGCINSSAAAGAGAANEFIVLNRSVISACTTQLNGGGVNAPSAPLHVYESTIKDSLAASSGGGVFFGQTSGVSNARALIERSLITNNASTSGFAGGGGGIASFGRLYIAAATVYGNRARFSGGGVLLTTFNSTLNMRDSTVAANVADSDANASGQGGGIRFEQATASSNAYVLANSVFANNLLNSTPQDCQAVAGATINSTGSWVQINDASCVFGATDTLNQPAQLGVLGSNGGPTQTAAPLTGSPLIDAQTAAGCAGFDQRGVSRPQDGDGNGSALCDRGAVEVSPTLAELIFANGFE
jgi:CSLREA domain-containing protein